jgi:hypothetical protein
MIAIAVLLSGFLFLPLDAFARDGIGGFTGLGISAGVMDDGTAGMPITGRVGRTSYDYQEYTFITGKPALLSGTMILEKAAKNDIITSKYTFNLYNPARNIRLTREVEYETTQYIKDNGQTVSVTRYVRKTPPSERIQTESDAYTLRGYDFTRTSLIDNKPAVSYYSGNSWYRKVYEIVGGAATSSSGRFVIVEATGNLYGFDQYWGNADVEETNFVIEYRDNSAADGSGDNWIGTATVNRSQSMLTQLKYIENEPYAISFRGGFLEARRNDNVLEYSAQMPEVDAGGVSTDMLISYSDSTRIEVFPSTKRLVSPDLRNIKAHWAEESIAKLFGLEIFKEGPTQFNPDQFISRGEFAAALVEAAKKVPEDPTIKQSSRSSRTSGRKAEPVPIFTDVGADHLYFSQIEEAFNRGLMNPTSINMFTPNGQITVASAAVTFIRAMGLESLASYHGS